MNTSVSYREAAASKQQQNDVVLDYISAHTGNPKASYLDMARILRKSNKYLRITTQDIANIWNKTKKARYDDLTTIQLSFAELLKKKV